MCGNKAAWQIVVDGVESIDLELVGQRIEAAGFEVGIRTRLAWTFSGSADLTLYPSGKLLVKTQDKELAAQIAQDHVNSWVGA
ncbi:MAG: hypothetical protein CMB21_07325 [Euryarchaeota archaeon]|jgi:hypothetical protein|nr:hypothetical protein [Euryarchaeota archaeon]|tara:strand:- start:1730 stop:1978 length:249 start_codon:yes stop_codon:yes gene_type:complete